MKRKDTPLPSSDDIINKAASSAAKAHKKAKAKDRAKNVALNAGIGAFMVGLFHLGDKFGRKQ